MLLWLISRIHKCFKTSLYKFRNPSPQYCLVTKEICFCFFFEG